MKGNVKGEKNKKPHPAGGKPNSSRVIKEERILKESTSFPGGGTVKPEIIFSERRLVDRAEREANRHGWREWRDAVNSSVVPQISVRTFWTFCLDSLWRLFSELSLPAQNCKSCHHYTYIKSTLRTQQHSFQWPIIAVVHTRWINHQVALKEKERLFIFWCLQASFIL